MSRRRWTIERLFRLMKSDGLQLADGKVESAEGLLQLTAIAANAAREVLQLLQARDGSPELASPTFTSTEIAVLDHFNDENKALPRSRRTHTPATAYPGRAG